MKTKQIVFTAPGCAEYVERELGELGEEEVLVRTLYSLVSQGTEKAFLRADPNAGKTFPKSLGYCAVSRVVETGSAVRTCRAGDRVLVYHGFHASYVKVHETQLLKIEDERIDDRDAAFVIVAAMGCTVTIQDSFGCFPRKEDRNLQDVLHETAHLVYSPELIHRDYPPSAGITDMGDVSMVMPVCHAHIGGSEGGGHTYEYRMTNREMACIDGSKIQAGAVYRLLRGDGERAKKVLAEAEVPFPSVKEYFAAREKYAFFGEAVAYNADGTVTLRYHN